MPNIGPLELVIVLIVVLVIFGPKRLPELGRSLGGGLREFKDSITGKNRDEEPKSAAEVEAAHDESVEGELLRDPAAKH
jgi:sec-independent protein translocase protein TatA